MRSKNLKKDEQGVGGRCSILSSPPLCYSILQDITGLIFCPCESSFLHYLQRNHFCEPRAQQSPAAALQQACPETLLWPGECTSSSIHRFTTSHYFSRPRHQLTIAALWNPRQKDRTVQYFVDVCNITMK